MSTSSSITPLQFTGISQFSDDFQTILNRAVSIAELPVQALQNQQSDILQEKQLTTNLQSAVADLANSISALGTVGQNKGLTATSSDTSKVSVDSTSASAPATYTITNITSVAQAASETSLVGYATEDSTPVSSTGTVKLTLGNQSYTLTLGTGSGAMGANTLDGLRDAINQLNVGVTASVLSTGSGSNSYYLSVTANDTGATTLKLVDDPGGNQDLMSSTAQGDPASSATSLSTYATEDSTPVSSTGDMKLVVGGQSYSLSLGTDAGSDGPNTLDGVRDAINALGAGVTASVVSNDSGGYSLSITTGDGQPTTLGLVDDPGGGQDLLTDDNQGSDAVFNLNGLSVDQASNEVTNVIPGVSFTILGTTDSSDPVTLSLASNSSQLENALNNLVTNYNTLASQVNAQMGPQAGLLAGDSLIRTVQNDMRQLAEYQGSGSIQNLADLGIEFSTTGQMSLDTDKLQSLSDSDLQAAFSFLGSSTTGLGALSQSFTEVSDPLTGLIKLQQDQYDTSDQRITDQISTMTDRINAMQTAMSSQLQAADALVAQLQSQQSILTASIQALNYTAFGVQTSSSGSSPVSSSSSSSSGD